MQSFIHFKIKIMIKNYELRLGNYVKSKNYHYEITEIGNKYCRINDIGSDDYDYDYPLFKLDKLMPIPLNEEWLTEFGFKIYGENDYPDSPSDWYWCKIGFDFSIAYKTKKVQHINNKVKYVHQLQNLYFALTGSELQVNVA